MGMSKLNVFVSGYNEPCALDDSNWYIGIFDCKLQPFDWCAFKYKIPAKCGFAEVRLPPGSYIIIAVHEKYSHMTCPALVHLGCEETKCVKLLMMGGKFYFNFQIQAIKALTDQNTITKAVGDKTVKALKEVYDKLPDDKYELDLDKFIKAKVVKKPR